LESKRAPVAGKPVEAVEAKEELLEEVKEESLLTCGSFFKSN
jgi:hypothetical protein